MKETIEEKAISSEGGIEDVSEYPLTQHEEELYDDRQSSIVAEFEMFTGIKWNHNETEEH